jgi:Family of unknown function (DUF5947)
MTSALQRMARRAAREREEALEHCDLCSAPIAPEHRHLLDVGTRELMCACRPCSLLFDRAAAGAAGRHYRLVPDRRLRIDDLELDDVAWADLRLPVELAFFFHSSPAGRVQAFYPSPMGATESLLGLDAWTRLVTANPVLAELEPDVEALLVDRTRDRRAHWLVPVDRCYALVGIIRTHWRGLAGGSEVWDAVERFFAELERQATVVRNDGREATWQPSRSASAT